MNIPQREYVRQLLSFTLSNFLRKGRQKDCGTFNFSVSIKSKSLFRKFFHIIPAQYLNNTKVCATLSLCILIFIWNENVINRYIYSKLFKSLIFHVSKENIHLTLTMLNFIFVLHACQKIEQIFDNYDTSQRNEKVFHFPNYSCKVGLHNFKN